MDHSVYIELQRPPPPPPSLPSKCWLDRWGRGGSALHSDCLSPHGDDLPAHTHADTLTYPERAQRAGLRRASYFSLP